jgi:hypothetical protein
MIVGPCILMTLFFCLWGCHKQQEDEVFNDDGPTWYSDTEELHDTKDKTE